MTSRLAIEVEYLTGVVRAANDRGDGADWPPQPDRLFSAFVATWAARGERPEERAALEWLENQPAPLIEASAAQPRDAAKVFVPPNDDAPGSITILPDRRRRQERRFAACVPQDPVVRWLWPELPDPAILDALTALAHDTSYLGHSASLVRCTLRRDPPEAGAQAARRAPYPGRLAELERAFRAGQRPAPGASLPRRPPLAPTLPASVFGSEWIIFAHADGLRPDAVASALACKALLKAIQAGYGPGRAPAWVSGHKPDGAPLTSPHLAALPLLDAGWEWSRGRLMGLALVLPRELEARLTATRDPANPADEAAALAEEYGFFRALAAINQGGQESLEIVLRLPGGQEWRLRREPQPEAQSLRPQRYLAAARFWGSVTPIALDRHPKKAGEAEALVAEACARIGLPKPRRVVLAAHSAIRGAPSVRPGRHAPAWTGWRLPPSLASRRLTHAVLGFAEQVAGPVVLGAGRFTGLGLCLPLRERDVE
jgi:CRISPR-associated protein Csb2